MHEGNSCWKMGFQMHMYKFDVFDKVAKFLFDLQFDFQRLIMMRFS